MKKILDKHFFKVYITRIMGKKKHVHLTVDADVWKRFRDYSLRIGSSSSDAVEFFMRSVVDPETLEEFGRVFLAVQKFIARGDRLKK